MPTYTIQLPDGRTMKAEASTEAAAMEGAKKWYAANPNPQNSKALEAVQKERAEPYRVPIGNEKRDEYGQTIYERTPEQEAEFRVNQQAERKAEKKAFEASRTPLKRAGDTAAMVGSLIPRTLTKGEYGLGDAIQYMLPAQVSKLTGNIGKAVSESERDFALANEGMLQTAANAGELMAGVPALNTMGAPLKGMVATLRASLASPRGTMAGAIRGTGANAIADAIPAPQAKALAQQTAAQANLPQNIQTIPEKLADIEAFRELGIKPFAPATGSKGTARASRTIEELPLVGGTVKSPKTDVELGLAKTQADIASELGARGSEEQTGLMLQKGLERYQGAGLTDLDPSTVKRQGIEPYQPLKKAQVLTEKQAENMQAAAPIRAANQGGMAQTSRGVQTPSAKPLEQIGNRRTNVEDLSDAQVARLISRQAQSRDTSFATKAEALYESAWRKIPDRMRKDDSANPGRTGWKNLQNTLREINTETNNQIAGQSTLGGELATRIMTARTHTSVGELRSIRTELGRALGNFGQFDIGLDRTQLKRLYGAASRDMEAGLVDLSNRAWLGTKSTGKDRVSVAHAREADKALYEFRRADRYFRQGMERIDKFMNVMGAKTPNEAAKKIVTALKEKTANPQMLREIKGVLRPEEVNALRGHVIENLGRGRAGAKEAETIFNVNNWATDFNAIMSHPAGREFMSGLPEGVTKKLENMARVVNRMKYYEGTKNHSGSAYSALGLIAMVSSDPIFTGATLYGGSAIVGKLLTSNAYLAWQEALMKAQLKAGNTAVSNARILAQYAKRLPALAKAQKDVDLQQAITSIGIAAKQQLQGAEKEKARTLSAPLARMP